MESLPFPTGKVYSGRGGNTGGSSYGHPDRATPCRGHACVIHDVECIWCGRLPVEQIDLTWAERALELERAARANPAPFGRFTYRLAGQMAAV